MIQQGKKMAIERASVRGWVEVDDFPRYEIHPNKGIRSKATGVPLRGRNWMGYPKVTLMKDGRKFERKIHRLTATHFIDNPEGLPIVNHKNSDRSDHRKSNLEWVTSSDNQKHRWKTEKAGLKKKKYIQEYGLGSLIPKARLQE